MGSSEKYKRIVMRVVCNENEELHLAKESLERSGIIYAEGKGEICFSVIPQLRSEDFQRIRKILKIGPHT